MAAALIQLHTCTYSSEGNHGIGSSTVRRFEPVTTKELHSHTCPECTHCLPLCSERAREKEREREKRRD